MTVSRRITVLAPLAVALMASVLALASPVSAQTESSSGEDTTADQSLMDDDHIVVETFTLTGDRIDTKAYSRDGVMIPVPVDFESQGSVVADAAMMNGLKNLNWKSDRALWYASSGSGGFSSASGCITVTIRNEKESVLGFTLYWFNTWTEWCWSRASKRVSSVSTGYSLEDVDGVLVWQGLIVNDTRSYNWLSGYPSSGYWHEKQGHFQNCVPQVGCYANSYPRNILKSHSDGTWYWRTYD